MNQTGFIIFSVTTVCLWGISALILFVLIIREFAYQKKHKLPEITATAIACAGLCVFIFYSIELWHTLERPPLKTIGETRMWYSIFIVAVSLMLYFKWKYKILMAGGLLFGILFISLNLACPDTFNKNLAPALQSFWFVPHVIVYIFSYAILGMSWLVSVVSLVPALRRKWDGRELEIADNLVMLGFGFLTLGLVFGALWAKEAWGHYWTWDPKETWAMITWLAYLLFFHYRSGSKKEGGKALWILFCAFILLIICWFGINYLAGTVNSIHSY